MRYIVLDLGNGGKDELFGKDLALTNAPENILKEISLYVKTSTYVGLPAEEVFVKQVESRGYSITLIASLDDIESYMASADDY